MLLIEKDFEKWYLTGGVAKNDQKFNLKCKNVP